MLRINLLPSKPHNSSPFARLIKFVNGLFFPFFTLVFVFAAAGSVVTVATTSTETSTAPAAPLAPSTPLQALCDQFWGTMSEDKKICEFEQNFHLNLAHAGNETLLTQIPVVPGDTVSVMASNGPQAIVGAVNYGPASSLFTASSDGYLSFRAPSHVLLFSVQQVRVLRCFSSVEGVISTVACSNAI